MEKMSNVSPRVVVDHSLGTFYSGLSRGNWKEKPLMTEVFLSKKLSFYAERRALYEKLQKIASKVMKIEPDERILERICQIAVGQVFEILPHCIRPGEPIHADKVIIRAKEFKMASDYLIGAMLVIGESSRYLYGKEILSGLTGWKHEPRWDYSALNKLFLKIPEKERSEFVNWLRLEIGGIESLYDDIEKGCDEDLVDQDLGTSWRMIEFRFYSLLKKASF